MLKLVPENKFLKLTTPEVPIPVPGVRRVNEWELGHI